MSAEDARWLAVLGRALQLHVVPHYRALYPPRPQYVEPTTGEVRFVAEPIFGPGAPDHDTYLCEVAEGRMLARAAHGVTHCVRVTFFAQALARLYTRAGRPPVEDPVGLALAAAFHDAARQDEGEDRWDAESARLLAGLLASLGAPEPHVEQLRRAVAEKDAVRQSQPFSSDAQCIVHDADCLDILRVLPDVRDFRPQELCLQQLEGLEAGVAEQLVREAASLIRHTETPSFKNHLERHSERVYEDFVGLLWLMQRRQSRWPLLEALLPDVFDYAARTATRAD